MSHPRISASALERLALCPASIAMPQVSEGSSGAARGTRLHQALEALVRGWPRDMAAGLTADPEEAALIQAVQWENAVGDLAADSRTPEVPFLVTFREDGPGIASATRVTMAGPRAYPFHARFQVAGTVDVLGWTSWDQRLVVVDWKTGGDVVSAVDNAQLRFAAVAASQALEQEVTTVDVRIAYVRPDGRVDVDRGTLGGYELLDAAHELEEICKRATRAHEARHLPISSLHLTPSPLCRHCPALRSCPAMVGAARHLLTSDPPSQEVLVDKLRALSTDDLALAHQRKELLKTWLTRLDDAFDALATEEPLSVGDGYELRRDTTTRRTLPLAAICALARSLGATDADIEALRVTSTSETVRLCRAPGTGRGRPKPRGLTVVDG